MVREVQWNVQRSKKLHLDWFEPDWPVGCMDEKALDEVNQGFAAIAMQMEDLLPELLRPADTPQTATATLELLEQLLSIIANRMAHIQSLIEA
jgi:hypothetical protein